MVIVYPIIHDYVFCAAGQSTRSQTSKFHVVRLQSRREFLLPLASQDQVRHHGIMLSKQNKAEREGAFLVRLQPGGAGSVFPGRTCMSYHNRALALWARHHHGRIKV